MADASVYHVRKTTCLCTVRWDLAWHLCAVNSSVFPPLVTKWRSLTAPKLMQVLVQTSNAPCADRRNSALLPCRVISIATYLDSLGIAKYKREFQDWYLAPNHTPTPHIAKEQERKLKNITISLFPTPLNKPTLSGCRSSGIFVFQALLADHQIRAPRKSLAVPVWAIRLGPVPAGCACSCY